MLNPDARIISGDLWLAVRRDLGEPILYKHCWPESRVIASLRNPTARKCHPLTEIMVPSTLSQRYPQSAATDWTVDLGKHRNPRTRAVTN